MFYLDLFQDTLQCLTNRQVNMADKYNKARHDIRKNHERLPYQVYRWRACAPRRRRASSEWQWQAQGGGPSGLEGALEGTGQILVLTMSTMSNINKRLFKNSSRQIKM